LHKDIYTIGHRLSKRDKLGIHSKVEEYVLGLLSFAIEAAFTSSYAKLKNLETARVRLELLKNIVRTEHELEILDQRTYLRLAEGLVEVSKMLNGWISYITQKKPV